MATDIEKLKTEFAAAGQSHVFAFWDSLDGGEKASLAAQLESVDLGELGRLDRELVFGAKQADLDFAGLEPAPYEKLPADKASDPAWAKAKKAGEEAIRAGRLAAFVVAGGQGTRLGFDAPKGLYPVSPVKHKSLFEIFAQKILRASRKYGVSIPWLVMTSKINDAATRAFFRENSFFGLDEKDVLFFEQGLMPAVDKDGRIILESRSSIAMTPDGHGGCLRAMCRSGALAELKRRGIDCISYFQVDNPLVDIIDPYFLGFHILGKSEMSSKMIPKAYALEKVGHFCMDKGRLTVVEYSDLPEAVQRETDSDGRLKFNAGSVAIHILDAAFVERLGSGRGGLPFHRADKKIPYVDVDGVLQKPQSPNGIKFEMFVFDALPLAANPVIIEGFRGDEFSPVKNAEGVDSPKTCREDQLRQFARWLRAAGCAVEADATGLPPFGIEVSPLFATNVEDFKENWALLDSKPVIEDGVYIS